MLLLSLKYAMVIYRTERSTVEAMVDRVSLQEVLGKTKLNLTSRAK